ncbi:MAG: hypothetical protein IKL01_08370 [Mailhella sp.]|nr:hypothetical protein [Mailhella sp.]
MNGVDLRIEIGGRAVMFDEKAKQAGYFGPVGFEMTLVKNGAVREGWFGGTWARADVIATLTPEAREKYPTDPDAIKSVRALWTVKKTLRRWV